MSDKKVVNFTEFHGWIDHASGAVLASLGGIENHYRLGDADWVRTSAVLRIEYADPKDGEREPVLIETLNTVYKKKEQDS